MFTKKVAVKSPVKKNMNIFDSFFRGEKYNQVTKNEDFTDIFIKNIDGRSTTRVLNPRVRSEKNKIIYKRFNNVPCFPYKDQYDDFKKYRKEMLEEIIGFINEQNFQIKDENLFSWIIEDMLNNAIRSPIAVYSAIWDRTDIDLTKVLNKIKGKIDVGFSQDDIGYKTIIFRNYAPESKINIERIQSRLNASFNKEDHVDNIMKFEAEYNKTGSYTGVGTLGLYTMKKIIINQHDGNLNFIYNYNKGCYEFRIIFRDKPADIRNSA